MSSQTPSKPSISYKDAGVDIAAGNALVDRIKGVAKRTTRPEVMGGLGGFGAIGVEVNLAGGRTGTCGQTFGDCFDFLYLSLIENGRK